MADLGRSSSFLPTIKCSSCAQDIEISQMGDHVCGGPSTTIAPLGEPTPPPDSSGTFDRMPYKQNPINGPGLLKPGRAMPPRVDTSAANRPYFQQDQLTPVSASPSRSVSPVTPRSPFGRPLRSATAPLQRAPLSPEILSSNLDCAFPPFPTSKSATQNRSQPGSGYGMGNKLYAEPDPMYAPVSPRFASGGNILQRMNTIAPGPFDTNGRKRPSDRNADMNHQGKPTVGSLRDETITTDVAEIGRSIERPATTDPKHSRSTSSHSSHSSRSGIPRVPRTNGYGGFGPPAENEGAQQDLLRPENRSQTFPLRSESQEPPHRRPSEPATGGRGPSSGPNARRPIETERSSSGSPPRERNLSIAGPNLTRPLPPRGTSLIRPRTGTGHSDAPPVPNVNLADEFGIGNPYHTPTESQSSNASGYSEQSKASSRSSPPRSTTSQSRRKPSDTGKIDDLMSEIQSSMSDLRAKDISPRSSPPRAKAVPPPLAPLPKIGQFISSPEPHTDPAIQNGRLSPVPSRKPTLQEPPHIEPQDQRLGRPVRKSSRPTTAKGNCKGCGEAIKGKSVSSADGRLTGRYHKQCFVCNTCQEPFQTATFYVIDDSPYCERHYHKLNGSVCTTCDKGIEGQYLESERKQKFHPGCLTCADCKRSLRNDYFEMSGRVYCERDAFRRAQQGRFLGPGGTSGTNRMERRTTRLMMM